MLDASRHVTAFDLRARLIGRVALRAADFGHSALALSSIDYIADGALRGDHCRDLAQHFASIGDEVSARRAAAAIFSSRERSHAYALIAIELAAQGLWAAADQLVAEDVTDPDWRNHALQLLAARGNANASDISRATARVRDRRVMDPSAPELQVALSNAGEAVGGSASLDRLRREIEHSGLEARRAHIVSFWSQHIMQDQLLAEFLAAQSRPVLLKRLGALAPLVGMVSSRTTKEAIQGIGICASNWA